ncbi:hypothetical protein DMA10_29540 [Streptomyces sp. WAC 01420]|nr:hypothetical protein DLM49_03185 [Streptomyces sp. WAC 01438]RSM89994.1 hypothetical protein DMA10_29540 [Streptomyces sp. WAC 01420]
MFQLFMIARPARMGDHGPGAFMLRMASSGVSWTTRSTSGAQPSNTRRISSLPPDHERLRAAGVLQVPHQ